LLVESPVLEAFGLEMVTWKLDDPDRLIVNMAYWL
jgi:hypothetical protein